VQVTPVLGSLLGSVFWLAVTLGVLITFHEFGHFWVARRCGVKVERFSVGFGRALWSYWGKDGTEYRLAAIPLGGYVKMVDVRNTEVPEAQRDAAFWAGEFTSKPVGKRLAIVAAGPGFNLLFTVVAFWLMYVMGAQAIAPQVTVTPQSLAAQAGVHAGDRVVAVDGTPVDSYNATLETLGPFITARQPVSLTVQAAASTPRTVVLELNRLNANQDLTAAVKALGLKPLPAAPIAHVVTPGGPASAAGMKDGDRILRLNGQPVTDFETLRDQLQTATAASPTVTLDVQRGPKMLTLHPTARQESQEGKAVWVIGIQSVGPTMVTERLGPWAAVKASGRATWVSTVQTAIMMKQMVTGQASAKNVSGVIGIAQEANTSASLGVSAFLEFLALVSLNLAILNLLPIPVLDGGHLLFYVIEVIKGSPVSEKWEAVSQRVGLVALLALMSLSFYNDIHDLILKLVS
jgi:regulator of sigma E protease